MTDAVGAPRRAPLDTGARNEQAWNRIINPKPQLRASDVQIAFDPRRPSSMFDMVRPFEHAHDGVRALERGRIVSSPERKLKRIGGGVNGAMPVVRTVDRHTGTSVRAVFKSIAQGGAQERFAYELAAAVGMDHLFPRVGRRSDGTAAIELVTGQMFSDAGVTNANRLEKALRHSWKVQFPEMPSTEVTRRARIDRQLVQVFDFLVANGDRHGGNGMFDARTGRLTLIDHGLLNRNGAMRGGLVPSVRMAYMGGEASVQRKKFTTMRVEPEIQALMKSADRPRIEQAFKTMLRDIGTSKRVGSYGRPPTPQLLTEIMARLDDVARTGLIRVR